jgi:hypothetical protein
MSSVWNIERVYVDSQARVTLFILKIVISTGSPDRP